MNFMYLIRGTFVSREQAANHLAFLLGGDPSTLIGIFEKNAMQYFSATGATTYDDCSVGVAIIRAI